MTNHNKLLNLNWARTNMKRNIREEVKALQATNNQHGLFMTLEGDCSLGLYPNGDAWAKSDTSALLLSRCYNGVWENREQFLIWGQGVLDKNDGFEDGYAARVAEEQMGYSPYEK